MQLSKKLPTYLWPKVIKIIVYIINRLYTKINKSNISLEEAFSRIRPKLHHLKIFGCLLHIHVGHQIKNKLWPRSIIGIFISYDEYTKGYTIYLHHLKKIIVSSDVIFEKNKFIDYNKI